MPIRCRPGELPAREERAPGPRHARGAGRRPAQAAAQDPRPRDQRRAAAGRPRRGARAARRRPREGLPILEGWRYEEFGRDALDLVEGRLAFAIRDGKLVMTRCERGDDLMKRLLAAAPDRRLHDRAARGRRSRRSMQHQRARRPGRPPRDAGARRRGDAPQRRLRLRWIRPGDVVTMDYSPQRLNVRLDGRNNVEGFAARASGKGEPVRKTDHNAGQTRGLPAPAMTSRGSASPAEAQLGGERPQAAFHGLAEQRRPPATSRRSVPSLRNSRLRSSPAATPPLSRWPSRIA